ncbi:unnamed protein product [Alopecurus aequalis]
MALWTGMGQAATVAQLVGVDAAGLISMIVQAAVTARENKKECEQLASRVSLIADLLPHLHTSAVMRGPLAGLDDALREAHELVMSCQGRNAVYRLVMAGRQAQRFKDVQARIDSYLIVFPLVSHIVLTRRLDRISNVVLPVPDDVTVTSVSSSSSTVTQYSEQLLDISEIVHLAIDGAEVFTLAGIAAVTNIFVVDMIGGSGSGFVYKGRLHDGREVAIKRLMNSRHKEKDAFCRELTTISSLCHKNIVRLLGWCVEEEERLLVYEYMTNGTLQDHLCGQASSSSPVMASWTMRIQVLLGAARAIEYLHCYTRPALIHGDIKSSNIHFDKSWEPQVSDLGATVTWHKRNEDYQRNGNLNLPTCDVYCLGVVMLEILTGKKEIFRSNREQAPVSLVEFALPSINAGEVWKVLDMRVALEPTPWELKAVEVVARTAAQCLRRQEKDRPSISDVVFNLEMALRVNLEMALLVFRVGNYSSADDTSVPPVMLTNDTSVPTALLTDRTSVPLADDTRVQPIMLTMDTSVPAANLTDPTSVPSAASQFQQLEFPQDAPGVPDGIEEFTLAELAGATNNFSLDNKTAAGGYSKVYKGRLHDGRDVAIKRMDNARDATEEFNSELAMLSCLRHKNIVRLFGCCVEGSCLLSPRNKEEEDRLLIFEYMHNGTLWEHLQNVSSSPVTTSWKTRIQVLLGVSRAIEYLHCYAVPSVIHRDIKSSNILLDASWMPRVCDFGASVIWDKTNKESRAMEFYARGTVGYLDPEYCQTGSLKPTSDVYSFGVVMLEVLTGKRPFITSNSDGQERPVQTGFVCLPLHIIEAGELGKVMDRRPAPEPTPRQLEALEVVAHSAARCVQLQGKDRPAISDVVASLETALKLICRDDPDSPHLTSVPSAGSLSHLEAARLPDGAEELTLMRMGTARMTRVYSRTIVAGGSTTVYKGEQDVALKRVEKGLHEAQNVFRLALYQLRGAGRGHRQTFHVFGWCTRVLIIALFLAIAFGSTRT